MIGLALTLMLAGAEPADPIGPALAGKVQCYAPNVARKTCSSIGAYARTADGHIDNRALVLVSPSPVIILETTSSVTVRAGAICGPVTARDLDAAKITVDGRPIAESGAASLKQAMKSSMATILDHEICTRYTPEGEVLKAEVSVDGRRVPAMDQQVMWVSESDGFRVAP